MARSQRIYLLAAALLTLAYLHPIDGRVLHAGTEEDEVDEPAPVYNTEHPYACTMNMTSLGVLCTGVLVNSSWVATAAHCVDRAKASEIKIFCDAEEIPMNASEIVIPDGWLSIETLPMDLAMVKLKKPTDLPVAPLPGVNTTAVNGSLFVVEKYKDIDVTAVSEAEYVEHATCNSTFLWTRSLEPSQMCAEATKCISDTASALFLDSDVEGEGIVLMGIASFGTTTCKRHDFPLVYSSVKLHALFITSVIDGTYTPDDETDDAANEDLAETHASSNSSVLLEVAKAAIAIDDAGALSVTLDLGLSPDATVDMYGRSLLHFAAESDAYHCAQVLVEAGANIEILEEISAATPVHFAAANGSIPVAKVVLEAGAYVNAVDDSHMTPLHYVVVPEVTEMGKLTMLMFLLDSGANLHEADNTNGTALHHAAAANWVSATNVLIKRGANLVVFANDGGTPLHWAARAGADDTVEVLIDAGAQLEARPDFGLNETVLSFAVRHDAPLSTIKILVNEGGADVNAADAKEKTPLHRAARNGNYEVMKFLLKKGADPTAKNIFRNRPIEVFCHYFNCDKPKHAATIALLEV